MKSNFTVYPSLEALRGIKEVAGIYLFEVGDLVKIGRSQACGQRVRRQLSEIRVISDRPLGRIAISRSHVNWRQTEGELHKLLGRHRMKGTEFFRVELDEALAVAERELEFLTEGKLRKFERRLVAEAAGASIVEARNYWRDHHLRAARARQGRALS